MKYKRVVYVSSLLQIVPVSFVGGGRIVGASLRLSGQQSTVHLRDATTDGERWPADPEGIQDADPVHPTLRASRQVHDARVRLQRPVGRLRGQVSHVRRRTILIG